MLLFFILFLSFQGLFVAKIASVPRATPIIPCFEYELQNECSSFLSFVFVNSSVQEAIFDSFSLNISDVRMFSATCRRPLLWYACGLLFPRCPNLETEEEQFCQQVEGCHQVNERCERFGITFDCVFPPFDEESECTERISKEIEKETRNPVEVETCLGEDGETIQCCPDPFTFDSGGECVVKCLQYVYGERFERGVRITLFILMWFGVITTFLGLFPFAVMTFNFRYPNFLIPLVITLTSVANMVVSFAVFAGGPEEYICGDEENFLVARNRFVRSTVAGVQMALASSLFTIVACIWVVTTFNTFCFVARSKWKFFNKYVEQPVSTKIRVGVFMSCLLIALPFSLLYFIYFFTHDSPSDEPIVAITPFINSAYPFHQIDDVFRISITILASIVIFIVLISIALLLSINWRIFYYQWRGLFLQVYLVLFFVFWLWVNFGFEGGQNIIDYIQCVATNPRFDPPPCERVFRSDGGLFCVYLFLFYLFPLVMSVVFYLSNPLVLTWWTELILNQNVIRSVEQSTTVQSSIRE